jgi:hypothetical protein
LYFLLAIATFGTLTVPAKLAPNSPSAQSEKDQIYKVVDDYFNARYLSFSTLKSEDISSFVSDNSDGKSFKQAEQNKLDIELHFRQVNKLRYLNYTYFLENQIVNFDPILRTAEISLDEGFDVVFEAIAPTVSKMRGLHHVIKLQKTGNTWKIVSDQYHDDLWNFIRWSGKSKSEIIASIDTTAQGLSKSKLQRPSTIQSPSLQSIVNNSYDRAGAVFYADTWARYRNPDYDDFSIPYGDCTNFISQAMYEGGKAPMVMPINGEVPAVGTTGWYYLDINYRAKAWTLVDEMYKFLVSENIHYREGLVGKNSDYWHMELGDVIQIKDYDEEGHLIWSHGMIVTGYLDMGDGTYEIVVDAHSNDCLNCALTYYTWVDIRYIHIIGIKRPVAFLPLTVSNGSGSPALMASQTSLQTSYPAPLDPNAKLLSGSNTGSREMAYPAP